MLYMIEITVKQNNSGLCGDQYILVDHVEV